MEDTRGIHRKRINYTSIQSSLSAHPQLSFHSLNDDRIKWQGGVLSKTKKGNGARSNGCPKNPTVWVRTLGNFDSTPVPRGTLKNKAILFRFKKAPRRTLVVSSSSTVHPKQTVHDSFRTNKTTHTHATNISVHINDPRPAPLPTICIQLLPLFVYFYRNHD